MSSVDPTMPLNVKALLILDPYPLADSVNFQLASGEIPLRVAEKWLSRELKADVKLQHAHGERFTTWINGSRQGDTVEIRVHAKRIAKSPAHTASRKTHFRYAVVFDWAGVRAGRSIGRHNLVESEHLADQALHMGRKNVFVFDAKTRRVVYLPPRKR